MARAKLAYTLAEMAELLQVSESTVRRDARAGLIPHVKVGQLYRFPVVVIDRWLQEQAEASLAPDEVRMLARLAHGV